MIKLIKKRALLQYIFLLFLIMLTTYLVYTTLDVKLIPYLLKIVNFKYIYIGVVLILTYIAIEVYVTYIIINSINQRNTRGLAIKLATMGLYYNLVTPFASGSQPMQIYAMTKYDLKLSKAVAIVTNKTVIYQMVVTIYCGTFILFNLDLLKTELTAILVLMCVGLIVNITTIVIGLLIIFSPLTMKKLLGKIIYILYKINIFKSVYDGREEIENYIDEYHNSIIVFVKNKKVLVRSIIFTVIQLTVYFSIAFCIYKTFNLNKETYITLLALQVFLYMSVSPAPTPGNVGANEIVFLTIFTKVFPKQIIGYSVFLYSVFVYYIIVIICGIFTIITHYKIGKLKKYNKEEIL
ncbi:MAG: lysylphosphatidylglycerol synthase transmembrane domain-containing protein [Peptostreptococcaceae bacterium]